MVVPSFTSTEIAAWFGAIVALLVLIWDILKEARNGARLGLSAVTNMQIFDGQRLGQEHYVSVSVVNKGNLPTTVTHLMLIGYDNLFQRIRQKGSFNGAVIHQAPGAVQLPHVLKPGEIWQGLISQSEARKVFNDHSKTQLYVAIGHAASKRFSQIRVNRENLSRDEDTESGGSE